MANTTPSTASQSPPGTIPDDIGGLDGPTGSMLGKYYCRLMIGKYRRPTPFQEGAWDISTRINLPLPDILQDNTSVKYNGVELESVGDAINGNIGIADLSGIARIGVANFGAGGSALLSKGAGAAAGAFANRRLGAGSDELSNIIGGAVTEGVKNTFPADKVQSAFEQIIGAAPNPNPSVAFQGPNLREFQLTWTFFPTNETESNNIHNIIKILKRASLPRNSIETSGAILDYPDMCQLNFFPWDESPDGSNPWFWNKDSIIRIKKCVMNNVSVDYNVSNIPGFFAKNGKPVAIKLSIGFSEIEYMISNDWGAPETDTGSFSFLARVIGRTAATLTNNFTGITANNGSWTT